ncbi:probable apyrase 6 [Nymphaea colorata]|nr:probable apyrase 6 [Nymphaea colorata]XP_031493840.1 probable apyrase 6 [Nymphaea colorata]
MDFSTLQSRISSAPYIPPHRTQIHPRIHPFSSLNSKPASNTFFTREKCWIFLALLILVTFVVYLFSIARGVHFSSKFTAGRAKGYGIIIDAGDSGSRVHVFEFLTDGDIPFVSFNGKGSDSVKSREGLSAYASDPKNAGGSLVSLLQFAKKKIPVKEWATTKLQLMVTTGLEKVDPEGKRVILESCRQVLRSSGFLFKDEWAAVTTGRDEGIYAWVAANYALGTLGGDPWKTIGVVELGGTSLQVTFVPREPPPLEFSRVVKLGGTTYNLYSHSLLHFGQDAVWALLHEAHNSVLKFSSGSGKDTLMNPCIPRGYFHSSDVPLSSNSRSVSAKKLLEFPTGNFSACVSDTLMLLGKVTGKCMKPPCRTGSIVIPEFQGKYFSAQDFFYTSKFFGLVPRASLSELVSAGHHYCEEDWNKLKNEHSGMDEEDLLQFCFSSAYVVALLHNGLGIPMDVKRIGFANQAGNVPLDWTLGAFIQQIAMEAEPGPEIPIWAMGKDSFTFFTFFVIFFLAVIFAFFISKWQKPQVKTVYDLEKGRYIITRIPR